MENYIELKKRETLKIGIKDENGIAKVDENGNEIYIEFDLEDITLPDKYNKAIESAKKAIQKYKNQLTIIDKKQDTKGKNEILSVNTKAKIKATEEYYKELETALNLFLGENGISKIFGESRYITMFNDFAEMFEPILPKIKIHTENIKKKIQEKYKTVDENVLKDE